MRDKTDTTALSSRQPSSLLSPPSSLLSPFSSTLPSTLRSPAVSTLSMESDRFFLLRAMPFFWNIPVLSSRSKMHPSSTMSCFELVLVLSFASAHLPLPILSPPALAVFRTGVFDRVVWEGSMRMYPRQAFLEATDGIVPLVTLSTLMAMRFVPSIATSKRTSLPFINRLSLGTWKNNISLLALFSSKTEMKPKWRRTTTSLTTPTLEEHSIGVCSEEPSANFRSTSFMFRTETIPDLRLWKTSHVKISPGEGGTSSRRASTRLDVSKRRFLKGFLPPCFPLFLPLDGGAAPPLAEASFGGDDGCSSLESASATVSTTPPSPTLSSCFFSTRRMQILPG
mmetsp:Transcript_25107/g.56096  ORF Transcript_25107/g.56096 Transcript_25107/m.56096 type:complete len:339 (-) Transcript_25107:577-1593(-)